MSNCADTRGGGGASTRTHQRVIRISGLALKAHRETLGWTQQRLAEAVGISQTTVSLIEHGHRGAKPALIREFAKVLRVPISLILQA